MTFSPLPRTVAAGGILGGIFGIGIFIGFASMWDFLLTLGVPLVRAELLELALRSFNPLFLVIALIIGVVMGFCVGTVAVLEGMAQVVGFVAMVVLSFLLLGVHPLIPLIVGYALLLAYQRWSHIEKLALLTFVVGLVVGYIPWNMNGGGYPAAAHSTNRYAQAHNLAPYRIAVNWVDSGSSETEIYLSDGKVLTCTIQRVGRDNIECVE